MCAQSLTQSHRRWYAPATVQVIGGLILLLSFATQALLLDYYNDRADTIRAAVAEHAEIDKSAQLSELLYLSLPPQIDSELGSVKWQRIEEAARRQAASSILPAASHDSAANADAARRAESLLRRAGEVRDYRSYLRFLDEANRTNAVFATAVQPQLERIEAAKSMWRTIYLILDLLGTVLVLSSEAREALAGRDD